MMLARTADNLYWLARYIERAEQMARILDVSYRMALLPRSESAPNPWQAGLDITDDDNLFPDKYDTADQASVMAFLALDRDHPSSIWSCIRYARENARILRSIITTEMFESVNATWLQIRSLDTQGLTRWGEQEFLEWVKERAQLFRGVIHGTMTHDESFHFTRLGTYVERADNTVRLLNVKARDLHMSKGLEGDVDFYQWGAMLRAVSALRAYNRCYHAAIDPRCVVELLTQRPEMPRSLVHCLHETDYSLDMLGVPETALPRTRITVLNNLVTAGGIDGLLNRGLEDALGEYTRGNNLLAEEIQQHFHMAEPVSGRELQEQSQT